MSEAAEEQREDKRCARCDVGLFSTKKAGFEVFGCGTCGGAWLDSAATAEALTGRGAWAVEIAEQLARKTKANPAILIKPASCPECREPLSRVVAEGEELDVCSKHGTWFNRGELYRITSIVSHPIPATASPPAFWGKPPGTYRFLEIFAPLCLLFAGLSGLGGLATLAMTIDAEGSGFAVAWTIFGTVAGVMTFMALRDASRLLLDLSERR